MTTTLKHPVSQPGALCPAILFLPEDQNHRPQTPNFREMAGRQNKAVVDRFRNDRVAIIRKIEFSRDLWWDLLGCIDKINMNVRLDGKSGQGILIKKLSAMKSI
jgi:hypothetical protein